MPSDDSSVRDVLSHQSLKVSRDDPGPRPMIAVLDARPGLASQLREKIAELAAHVRREPGCLTFTAYEARDVPGRFYLYEVYASSPYPPDPRCSCVRAGEREQGPDRAGEEDEDECADQDDAQCRAGGDVPAAGPDRFAEVLARQRVRGTGAAAPGRDHRDHRDDCQEGRRVDDEDRPGAGRGQDVAADGGADRPREVLVH